MQLRWEKRLSILEMMRHVPLQDGHVPLEDGHASHPFGCGSIWECGNEAVDVFSTLSKKVA